MWYVNNDPFIPMIYPMKYFYFFLLYTRFWWLVCIKVKSTDDKDKQELYYRKADELEQKMYKLVS
jgi:hypothetical protein